MPIAERTPDAELVDAGKLIRPDDGRLGNNDQRSFWAASDPGSPPRKDEMPEGAGSSGRGRPPMAIKPIASMQDRRRAPAPGKWWVGGNERRGRTRKGKQAEFALALEPLQSVLVVFRPESAGSVPLAAGKAAAVTLAVERDATPPIETAVVVFMSTP